MKTHLTFPKRLRKAASGTATRFGQTARLALCALTAAVLGCVQPATAQDVVPSATMPVFIASAASRSVSFEEQKLKIGVGGSDYTATVNASWLTLTKEGDGVLLDIGRNDGDARTAQLTIAYGSSEKVVSITQEANPIASVASELLTVSSATASSSESSRENAPITNAIDGSTSTYYHSTWSSSTTFPVTLTFHFAEAQHVDRIVYTPRGNGTGVFKTITVLTSTNGTSFLEDGSATFENNDNQKIYHMAGNGADGVKAVRISVTAGYSAYVSAAEIQFFDDSKSGGFAYDLFADDLLTALKPTTTQADIDGMENALLKQLAQDLLNGTYSTDYRVGTFHPYRPIANLQSELRTAHQYNRHENPTGIYFKAGEQIAVMASGIGDRSIQLEIYNFGLDGLGENSKYNLQDGMNVFTAANRGTSYVLYYPTDYETAPDVKLHIIYGSQNGYFNLDTDDNAVWKKLLANAKGDVLDIVTPRVHMAAPLYALKAQCPARGLELAQKLDSVVWREWEIMGYHKHGRAPKNHQFVRPSASGLFASTEGAYCAWGSFGGWVSPVSLESWGLAHELGHNNQVPAFTWTGMTEVTNNIKSAWVQYTLPWSQLRLEDESINCVIGSVRGGRMQNFISMDVVGNTGTEYYWQTETEYNSTTIDHFVALVPLWQMVLYTRAAGKSPDAFPDWYELVRTTSSFNSAAMATRRVNFLRYFCAAAKLNFFPFYEKAGMLKPMNNVFIDDYTSGYMTISQSTLRTARNAIERQNYTEVPAELVYMNAYNMHIYRDNIKLQDLLPVGTGCTATTLNGHQVIKVDNYAWKGAVGYETYDAEGNLLQATIYGLGDTVASDRYTYVIWKPTSQTAQPAYIMAVGCDGTRVKCYEP